jgi:misacylated tRNA(Ala) deacylase
MGLNMTELLYQTDSYLREFDATVVAIADDGGVILDKTAFFPGGGGQPCDYGELASGRRQSLRWRVARSCTTLRASHRTLAPR